MKAIQSVVYALFKVNIFANAGAKAYSNMAKGASKAKKEAQGLAGIHDEINNVQTNDNSDSGSGGGGVAPNIDLSKIDNEMSEWAQKIYDFFKPLKDSWDTYGEQVVSAFHNALNGIGKAVGAMWKSVETIFTNGTIYSIIANILNSIGEIGKAWANAWNNDNNGTEIIQSVANIIEFLTQKILELVSSTGFQSFLNGVLSAFSGIVQFLEPIIKGFIDMSGAILQIVLSGIGSVLQWVGNALQGISQNQTAVDILTMIGEALAIVVALIIAWNVAQILLNVAVGIFKALVIAWQVAQVLLNVAMAIFHALMSPITLVILGIVAAIAVVILIIQNWGAIWEWLCELVGNICKAIGDFFAGLWEGICKIFSKVGQWFGDRFKEAWNFIVNIFKGIGQWFADRWKDICKAFSSVGTWFSNMFTKAWNFIVNIFKGIGQWFSDRWKDICKAFSSVGAWFSGVFSTAWNFITGIFKGIGQWFGDRWNDITKVFSNVGKWFSDRFNNAIDGIKKAFSSVGQFFRGVWQGIRNVFSGVANWFKNIFSNAWQAVKNVFSTGGKIFEGIKDGILSSLKKVINAIIKGINTVIAIPFNGINSALRAIKSVDILGIKPFSWISTIKVPQIPQLAKGGVLYDDTVVRVGEYSNASSNPEIVTPQNIMRETFEDVMSDFSSSNGNNDKPINLSVYVGNTKLGEILLKELRDMKRQTGKDIEVLVGG